MRVLVTGASGFLGSHLVRSLLRAGHEVHGSASADATRVALPPAHRRVIGLGDELDPRSLEGFDAVIHCAHDPRVHGFERNVEGTRRIARAAREGGAVQQIFVGSYSAHARAVGQYGRAKWELERCFVEQGQSVVKPGLVIGAGGLFARILTAISRLHVAPLIDGGRGVIPVVGVADVAAATTAVLDGGLTGVHRLYLPERVTLRELIDVALEASGTRAMRIPVPHALADLVLRGAEWLHFPTPIGRESLGAFRANQAVADPSDLSALVSRPQTLEEMVRAALGDADRDV